MERAFVYGDLLFETIAVRKGEICHLQRHVNRLNRGFSLLQMAHHATTEEISKLIVSAIGLTENARIRLVAYRGASGFYRPDTNGVKFSLEVFPLPAPVKEIEEIVVYDANRKSAHPLSTVKSGNALVSVLASVYAEQQGAADAVMLNTAGEVCEATASNIFMVQNGTIKTPALDSGCVWGVMREVVLERAASLHLAIEETAVSTDDLLSADELFLTNTIHGITSVRTYKGRQLKQEMGERLRRMKE